MTALLHRSSSFSHFSDVSWVGVPFMMLLTTMRGLENNMAAVFVSLRLSVLGASYTLQFALQFLRLLSLTNLLPN